MRLRLLVLWLVLGSFFLLSVPPALAQTREDCLACHSDKTLTKEGPDKKTVSLYADEAVLNKSTHAKLACVACHTGFNPDDLPHKAKIEPVACQRCHAAAVFKHPFHPDLAKAISGQRAPVVACKTCHGTHNVESPKTPGSKFSASRLIESCGACHQHEAEQ